MEEQRRRGGGGENEGNYLDLDEGENES